MTIEFLPIAKLELDDAISYYDLQVDGLGEKFKNEIKSALSLIERFPYAWNEVSIESVHKYLLHKFPYAIYYFIDKNKILVIAVAHQHQKPNYWIERVES